MNFWPFKNVRKTKDPSLYSGSRSFFINGKFTTVTEETAMTVAAFNRGVMYLATTMAKLPFLVKTFEKEELPDHKLNFLLNRSPNFENSAFMLKTWLMISAVIKGDGYLEIERSTRGKVVALHPILYEDVVMARLDTGELIYRVTTTNGNENFLRAKDVFHLRNFHTTDSLNGNGVVAYANETLGVSQGANKFANSLFANAGMPSGSLNVPGKLSPEASDRIKEGWQAASSGRKTGSVVVLEEGTTFTPITFAPDVLQFIESRKFGIPEIARFLGVPPTKLYSQEQSTYNNVEQDNLSVVTDTVSAWAANLEGEADIKLIGRNMKIHTEIDLFELSRGDMESRSQYYTRMMGIGTMTPNQVRAREGMSPYEDGDRYYIATNNFTPTDKVDDVIDAQINSANRPEENNNETSKEVDDAVVDYLKSAGGYRG